MSRKQRWFLLLSVPIGLMACHAQKDASAKTASATASDEAPPPVDSARVAKAKQTLRSMDSPDVDLGQRARIAAVGLNEGRFGLRRGILKAVGAVVSDSIDPSQCATILGAGLEESEKAAVSKRCGTDLESLRQRVHDLPAPEKASAVVSTCKITLPKGADATKLNPWAVLAAAVLHDELDSDPASNADEKRIADALVGLCPL